MRGFVEAGAEEGLDCEGFGGVFGVVLEDEGVGGVGGVDFEFSLFRCTADEVSVREEAVRVGREAEAKCVVAIERNMMRRSRRGV